MISSINSPCVFNARNYSVAKNNHKENKKSEFSIWLNNLDKVCTDGKDDGKISPLEKLKSFGKGLAGIVKAAIKHPITTALTIGAGIGLNIITGGAVLPIFVAAGIIAGCGMLGYGTYKAMTAQTDGQAKQAWETLGNGTFAVVTSAFGAKSAIKSAANAGVKSAQNSENLGLFKSVIRTFKITPEAIKVGAANIKGNYLTYTTGQIHANSNATRQGVEVGYQSGKGKKVDAYKIDINGTPEEVLAKNPGLSYEAETGKYYVNTSYGAKSYIDPNAKKGYMFVKYGPGDNNAVEGVEFLDTYVDHAKLVSQNVKSYVDPTKLEAGKTIAVAKEAPAKFKIVPEGTKYVGAEGAAEVQPKSVLRIDGQGRPYQSTVKYMLDRVQLSKKQIDMLKSVDPDAVEAYLAAKK